MTTKPNIFKRFYETVKPEVLRFPEVVISTILALEYFLSDKLEEKKFRLISHVLQGAGIVICLCALYPYFKNNSDYFLMHYICL